MRRFFALSLLAFSAACQASLVTYTDRGAWEAGLASLSSPQSRATMSFDGLPNGTDLSDRGFFPAPGISVSTIFNHPPDVPNESYAVDGQAHLRLGYSTDIRGHGYLQAFSADSRMGGFGFDVGLLEGSLGLLVSDNDAQVDFVDVDTSTGFFGFVDTSERTRLVVLSERRGPNGTAISGSALIDNVTIQSVPEPSSLVALGLIGAAFARRTKARTPLP